MPFPILTLAAQGNCPHGGKITFMATSSKVIVDGTPAMLESDQAVVAGCAFTVPTGKPQPCVKAKLAMKAAKVKIENKGVILKGPADMCESGEQIVQGPVAYGQVQSKVTVT